ncbi:hypothetical protein [Streptosporangium sp. NPDC000509]|uniref:hypothetical protein n=1 Tax=Streptosporangium sp. NPDC000509 TaxID=3366186 RepID=UPI0036C2D840
MPKIVEVQALDSHLLERLSPFGFTPEVAASQEAATDAKEDERILIRADEVAKVIGLFPSLLAIRQPSPCSS